MSSIPFAIAEAVAHGAGHVISSGTTGAHGPVGRISEYKWNDLYRNLIPDAGEIMEAYRRGYLLLSDAQSALSKHGIAFWPVGGEGTGGYSDTEQLCASWWKKIYLAHRKMPTDAEMLVLHNRGGLNADDLQWYWNRLGWEETSIRNLYQQLRYDIPGPSDLVRFSVRHVFEPDLIGRFGFNDEFNPILDIWHHGHGQQYPIFTGPFRKMVDQVGQEFGESGDSLAALYQRAGLPEPSWARAYWWSHWVWPSPTQSYMFLQQLRPGRHAERFPNEQEHPVFTVDDLNYLLRGNDYPPSFRPLLRAISYRVPGFRQVRQMREQNVIDEDEHREMYQDMGYSPRDARMLETSDYRKIQQTQRRAVEQAARGQLEKAYEIGAIDDTEFFQRLTELGMSDDNARAVLLLAQSTARMHRYERVIRLLHRQYIRGQITRTDASQTLNNVGMDQQKIQDYLNEWDIELNGDVRLISAQKAVKWACAGIIDIPSMISRLRNLHYLDPDIQAWVAEAVQCVAGRVAKAAAERVRQERQRVRDLRRAITEGRADIRWNQSQLARHGTQEQLANWYWQNLIPLGAVVERLSNLGWPMPDIEAHLAATKPGKPPGGQPRRD